MPLSLISNFLGFLSVTLLLTTSGAEAKDETGFDHIDTTVLRGSRLADGQFIPVADLEQFVDDAMRRGMAAEHVAGAAVAVVQHGQTTLLKGYGVSSVNPQKPVEPSRTLFRIGSISKVFVWVLLMREVEHGRINLDAPINITPRKKKLSASSMLRENGELTFPIMIVSRLRQGSAPERVSPRRSGSALLLAFCPWSRM